MEKDPIKMMNRVHDYWKENSEAIQAAERYDGSNYILKMLYRALNYNSMAANTTIAVSSAMNLEAERRRQYELEVSRDCIAAAICEIIDSDFEGRIEAAEDSERFWRDEYHDVDGFMKSY
ncbi:MAG: hypothetical protein IKU36_02180 [Bacteroidales bacterium]|nr:hypothetical protein [Bacteroidales bacterium]